MRTFTINRDEPVMVEENDIAKWIVLPAGTVLAEVVSSSSLAISIDTDDAVDTHADESHWVNVIASPNGATNWLPTEIGSFTEGEPDDLTALPLLTTVQFKHKYPSWRYLADEAQDLEQTKLEVREQEEREHALDMVSEKHGRFSLQFLRAVQRMPRSALLVDVVELAELYNDESLRQAAHSHPDGPYDGPHTAPAATSASVSNSKCAAQGAIGRMLIAEVMTYPNSRQVDIAERLGVDTAIISVIAYRMRCAGIFRSTKVNGRILLAPTERCSDFGLDNDSAVLLISTRQTEPGTWQQILENASARYEAPTPDPLPPDSADDYGYSYYC